MANIVGGVTSINNPRTNWAQNDPTKADYLKNKPNNDLANALKRVTRGKRVTLKDVSPLEHEVKVKMSGEKKFVAKGFADATADIFLYFDGVPNCSVTIAEGEYLQELYQVVIKTSDGGSHYLPNCDDKSNDNSETSIHYVPIYECNISGTTLTVTGQRINFDTKAVIDTITNTFEVAEGSLINGVATFGETGNNYIVTWYKPIFDGVNTPDVTLTVGGKNLFDVTTMCAGDNVQKDTTTFTGDEITTNFINSALFINNNKNVVHKAGTYTATLIPITPNAAMSFIAYRKSNKTAKIASEYVGAVYGKYSLKITANEDFYFCVGAPKEIGHRGLFTYKIQIEQGETATEYEPYKEPITYTPESDGTLVLNSVCPSMRFETNNDDVTLDIEYNRDIAQAFQELQDVVSQLQGLAVATIPLNEGEENGYLEN